MTKPDDYPISVRIVNASPSDADASTGERITLHTHRHYGESPAMACLRASQQLLMLEEADARLRRDYGCTQDFYQRRFERTT